MRPRRALQLLPDDARARASRCWRCTTSWRRRWRTRRPAPGCSTARSIPTRWRCRAWTSCAPGWTRCRRPARRAPHRRHRQQRDPRRALHDPPAAHRSDPLRRAAAAEHAVHPRHHLLDLRRRQPQPDVLAGLSPGDPPDDGDLQVPPTFKDAEFEYWFGDPDVDHGGDRRGGDVMPIGNGVVLIGMGERTSICGRGPDRSRRCSTRGGGARRRLRFPKSRAAMHLDTVFTLCDRDLVNVYAGASSRSVRSASAGRPAGTLDIRMEEQSFLEVVRRRSSSRSCASSPPAATLRAGARAVGRRQQRRGAGAGRGGRLQPQRPHQHPAPQGGRRGHHHRRLGARAGPWRPLHDLPDPARP